MVVCHVTTRMQPSVIVWDLQTVPDLDGFAAANDLVGKSDVEVREAIGDIRHHGTADGTRAYRSGSAINSISTTGQVTGILLLCSLKPCQTIPFLHRRSLCQT